MQFICGKTTCVGCGRLLDVTDDTVAATPVFAGQTPWSGFYHRGCFDLLPDAAALTRKWREYTEKIVRDNPTQFPVLAESRRFLVVRRAAERQFGVYYLDWWAEQRLRTADEWDEFAGFLAGGPLRAAAEAGEGEIASATGRYKVRFGADGRQARFSWLLPFGREADYPASTFEAYVAVHGQPTGPVDLAKLAADGLQPSYTDGEMARCQGVVKGVDRTRSGYRLKYTGQQTVAVELGRTGLTELQSVIARVTAGR